MSISMKIFLNFKNVLFEEGRGRVFGLDLLRAIAILLVLISHGRHYMEKTMEGFAEYLSFGGYLGVELFFVLSGFLIGGILLKIFEKSGRNITITDIKNFWIRRWFRTLPNYYLVLLINFIIVTVYFGYFHFDFRYLFFLQNFYTPALGNMNYAQSWSLTIEEWFYLITPVVLYLSVKILNIKVKNSILIAILFMIIVIPALKLFYQYFVQDILGKGDKLDFSTFRIVAILRLDSIIYGVLLSYINYYYNNLLIKMKNYLLAAGLISFVFIVIIMILQVDGYVTSNIFNIMFTSIGSFGLSLLLPYFNNLRIKKNNYLTRFITMTSVISYSLYLVHFSFVATLLKKLNYSDFVNYFLFWFLSYFLSILLYYFFESKMTKLREYYTNSDKSMLKLAEQKSN